MRVTFSLALSSLQFDPQTQLSSAPDLIKLLCTDSHQADKYSESLLTSTPLYLVLRSQSSSYWTIHSIWQSLSLLWKLWHHLASRHCRLLGFLFPPWSFKLCLLLVLPHAFGLLSLLCSGAQPLDFFSILPLSSFIQLLKKILSYNIIRYIYTIVTPEFMSLVHTSAANSILTFKCLLDISI